jgi:hypothetical protein
MGVAVAQSILASGRVDNVMIKSSKDRALNQGNCSTFAA